MICSGYPRLPIARNDFLRSKISTYINQLVCLEERIKRNFLPNCFRITIWATVVINEIQFSMKLLSHLTKLGLDLREILSCVQWMNRRYDLTTLKKIVCFVSQHGNWLCQSHISSWFHLKFPDRSQILFSESWHTALTQKPEVPFWSTVSWRKGTTNCGKQPVTNNWSEFLWSSGNQCIDFCQVISVKSPLFFRSRISSQRTKRVGRQFVPNSKSNNSSQAAVRPKLFNLSAN